MDRAASRQMPPRYPADADDIHEGRQTPLTETDSGRRARHLRGPDLQNPLYPPLLVPPLQRGAHPDAQRLPSPSSLLAQRPAGWPEGHPVRSAPQLPLEGNLRHVPLALENPSGSQEASTSPTTLTNLLTPSGSDEAGTTCILCNRAYPNEQALQKHITEDHEKTPIPDKKFPCPYCPKAFKQSSHLRVHVSMVHLQSKPFACQICKFTCASKSNLARHCKMVHKKEKPFKCSFCGADFVQSSGLRRHLRRLHSRETIPAVLPKQPPDPSSEQDPPGL